MLSPSPPLERATALLGALVRVRVEDCAHTRAITATSAAFTAMARIHRAMSFHAPASELSRINRRAFRAPVRIGAATMAVLSEAMALARASDGAFDPTMAPAAVRAGALPRPQGAPDPDPAADWRDVELDETGRTVRLHRPLWLDLGGIAKGYAVDMACDVLRRHGVVQGCVDAGGDICVFGPRPEPVAMDPGPAARSVARVVWLTDTSVASSGELTDSPAASRANAIHYDPTRRRRVRRRFVSVLAHRCIHADALTKVVLARGRAASNVLKAYGASAAVCSANRIWSVYGVLAA